jgi:hypothetical protein
MEEGNKKKVNDWEQEREYYEMNLEEAARHHRKRD